MQVVNTTIPAENVRQTTTTQKTDTLGYDAFLQLLIAQMKNQDPTEPLDASQYLSQLASFSNVEQSVKTNAKLDALLSSFTFSQADSLIGRLVTSADGSVNGTVTAVRITSAGAVAVLDNGKEVLVGAGLTIQPGPAETA